MTRAINIRVLYGKKENCILILTPEYILALYCRIFMIL